MRKIHQFHSGTAVGDAITNQMLLLRNNLRKAGYDSEIYAEFVADGLKSEIHNFSSYKGNPDNILIVHHSMGITPETFKKVMGQSLFLCA